MFILFLLWGKVGVSQISTFKGIISDKKTGQVIPYVTVNLTVAHVYSRADEAGAFKIYSLKNFGNDTLLFTSIGYLPFKVPVKDITGEVNIALTESVNYLSEVSISRRPEMILGKFKRPGYKPFEGASMMTRRFRKEDGYSYLQSISLLRKTDRLSGKGKAQFRVSVYNSESDSGAPDGIVYEQILTADTKETELFVDLRKYHILLPTDFFFVGVERVSIADGKPLDPKVNTLKDKQHSWVKKFGSMEWQRIYHRPAITATVL